MARRERDQKAEQDKEKRRGHGEGSISERKDGRWEAKIELGRVNGKRRRKVIYAKTKRELLAKLARAQHRQTHGLPLPPERETVGGFLDRWLDDSVKPNVRPRTYQSYKQLVNVHIKPALGSTRLLKLQPDDVQAFLNERRAQGKMPKQKKTTDGKEPKREPLSPRTVQYLRAVLRRALGQALKWGLIERNVATLVDPPRGAAKAMRPLIPEEAQALLAAVRGERLEALYTVALSMGLRQGEALGLRWEDIDLDRRTLAVRFQLQRIGREAVLVDPKTEKSKRTLQLPPFAIEALRRHRARQLEERLRAGTAWQENGLVFTTTIGTPLDGSNVLRGFQAILKREGLPKIRFHDRRHTSATLLKVQGVSDRVIMEILGHSQISMMVRYTHVLPEVLADASDRMQAALGGR